MSGFDHNEIAFEPDHRPAQTVEFVYPHDEEPDASADDARDGIRQAKLEAVRALLELLTCGYEDPAKIGRCVLLLAQLHNPVQTQRELALRLGITPGRVSQELNAMRAAIASVYADKEHHRHSQN